LAASSALWQEGVRFLGERLQALEAGQSSRELGPADLEDVPQDANTVSETRDINVAGPALRGIVTYRRPNMTTGCGGGDG
jgi:hypothetical protein